MKVRIYLALIVAFSLLVSTAWAKDADKKALATPNVLEVLKKGNRNHLAGKTVKYDFKALRTETSTNGQKPIATVLACSDSRVPVEHIFSQGLGDLFVIRVAGNVANVDEIASAEYGAEHLNTSVIVVMGHSDCGAVTAVAEGGKLEGNLAKLLAPIKPVVKKIKAEEKDIELVPLVAKAVEANVLQSMEDMLTKSPIIKDLVIEGKVQVLGAHYDISSGVVSWLGEHPNQADLLKK